MKLNEVFIDYAEKKEALRYQKKHPTQDVQIHITLCGKSVLKYEALLNIASVKDIMTSEMLKRIFERGLDKEFEYWGSK